MDNTSFKFSSSVLEDAVWLTAQFEAHISLSKSKRDLFDSCKKKKKEISKQLSDLFYLSL